MAELSVTSLSTDGHVYNKNTVYLTSRNAAVGFAVVDTPDDSGAKQQKVSVNYYIWRGFLVFETSPLTDAVVIDSATLGIYGSGDSAEANAGQTDAFLYEGTQADTLTTACYSEFGATLLSDDHSNWEYPIADDAYNTISLNAAGLAVINKTGKTKFCIRVAGDIDASVPTFANLCAYWASEKGAGYQPKLIIQYHVSANPKTHAVVMF